MTIAVNAIFFNSANLEGYGHYTVSIFKLLVQQYPEHQFVFVYDRPHEADLIIGANVQSITVSSCSQTYTCLFLLVQYQCSFGCTKTES